MKQVVVIGSDHAGYPVKQELSKRLIEIGVIVEDMGTNSDTPADFSPIAEQVAHAVAAQPETKKGILICGTGIGMSMMANKVRGIRAALTHDLFSAKATRQHNDSNVLCMGARIISAAMAWEIANVWLHTDFLGGKHERRIQYMKDYENRNSREGGEGKFI